MGRVQRFLHLSAPDPVAQVQLAPVLHRPRELELVLKRATLIDFQVEQEDSVYPMVPAGADLHKMIRRPSPSPIVETAAD